MLLSYCRNWNLVLFFRLTMNYLQLLCLVFQKVLSSITPSKMEDYLQNMHAAKKNENHHLKIIVYNC